MNLITQSQNTKVEANEILKKLGLTQKLQNFGKVEIIGSYKLDLMWQKDIDIYIKNPIAPNKYDLIGLMQNLFSEDQFFYFKIEDNTTQVKPELPKGVGMFIKLYSGWKFDLWFMSEEEASEIESITLDLFKKYNPEMKETILQYKKTSVEQGVYNKKFTSYDLYKAIIEDEIESIEKYLS